MAIPVYLSQKDIMWRTAKGSIFTKHRLNTETPTIFGYNQIKGSRPMSAGCCRALESSNPNVMDAFYPTIWSHPLRTVLIKNYSYGGEKRAEDDCCACPSFTVDFTADVTSGASPLLVTFTNLTVDIPGMTYEWTFGDGGISTLENPSYTYSAAGAYTVRLTVVLPYGSDVCSVGETKTGPGGLGYIVVT